MNEDTIQKLKKQIEEKTEYDENINELKEQFEVYEEELLKTTETLEEKKKENFTLMQSLENYKEDTDKKNKKINELNIDIKMKISMK